MVRLIIFGCFFNYMKFDVITIFPNFFNSFLDESLIQKSIQKKLNKFSVHDLRRWSKDRHKTIDGRPYGGGPGMILMAEPIIRALKYIKARNFKATDKKTKIILLSPAGKQFNQNMAQKFSKLEHLVLICGRYEGVDARVEKFIDEKISVGPYVLSGGEIPAMLIMEAVARLIPGYLGNPKSLEEESQFGCHEYPQYTRPEILNLNSGMKSLALRRTNKKLCVPKVLLGGNHKKIKEWKDKHTKMKQT